MFKFECKNNIDSILAISGLILGLVITSLYHLSPTIHLISIGLSLILGCSIYILLNKIQPIEHCRYKANVNEKRILDVLYLLLFSVSLIIWNTSIGRPFSYFLIFSLCAGVLALSIYIADNKFDYYVQFGKIILLSFNIKYSIYMFAGSMPSVDTYIHAKMNDLLAKSGITEVLIGKEMYFPVMHIQTAITEIISAIPIKEASNFAIIVPFILASAYVYLVGRDLFEEKIGLFAMLLVNVSDFHIYWGSAPQTTTYGSILYFLLIYVLFKVFYVKSNSKWVSISIFLIITLIITHAVSSFIFIVTAFALFLGSIIYNRLYYGDKKALSEGLFLISIVVLLQSWFVALYSKKGEPFFDQIVSSLHYYVTGFADFLNRPEATAEVAANLPPFIERLADTLGLSLYLFFAIIGSLIALSYRHRNQIRFAYIVVMIILFGITFAFPLFGMRNIIPSRWFVFEYFFVSMFAAFAIIQISSCFKRGNLSFFFIALIFISGTFFMSSNTISNLDSPLWLKEETISTTYTIAELKGAETLSHYSDNIFSDARFGPSVIGIHFGNVTSTSSLSNSINNREDIFKHQGKIFLWRDYMLDKPVRTFDKMEGYDRQIEVPKILGQETFNELADMNRIYDNREIIGYYIK